ncbi:uncharacterized protein A1O9_06033 [Exophiala aquamarina CBS 119918]|uniref:Uncharacterized protein n=1 Tax=Exophiala aquamarina CBS 119918 TaxID=1182545 RepID=A0A072PRF3_9EURO|nr:uncharacterized protein A1O9_06033 [Exophiala aquamarina CBS 119918]KEF58110.1 hypothetical protein A1O9_06033 [Exophiala aquamarina CBS 119918]
MCPVANQIRNHTNKVCVDSDFEASANPVLVLEDAPAGAKAGKAAGCKVLGLAMTHSTQDLLDAGADWVVPDLQSVNLVKSASSDSVLEVKLSNAIS